MKSSLEGLPKEMEPEVSMAMWICQVLLLHKEFEEELFEAAVDVPVDEAEVVAVDIGAMVGEFDGLAAALRASLALHLALEYLPREDVDRVQPGHELRVKQLSEALRGATEFWCQVFHKVSRNGRVLFD
jgi:hypothetical protein